jgi:CRP/FNR family transcriptional regulator, dissimilatory nitrate respiration regulator
MTSPRPDVLAVCPLFASVEGEGRERLSSMALRRTYRRGHTIFHEGQACPGLFVVEKGLVRIAKMSPTGREHVLHLVEPGGTFAEVAVIGGFPCPATAQALQATTCIVFPARAFMAALHQDHALCLQLLGGMSRWVHQLVHLLEDIVLRDAAGRVANYLLKIPAADGAPVTLPTHKRHLANHLNLTSETLSRVFRRLTDLGLIEAAGGRKLRLTNRPVLRQIARGGFPQV